MVEDLKTPTHNSFSWYLFLYLCIFNIVVVCHEFECFVPQAKINKLMRKFSLNIFSRINCVNCRGPKPEELL